MNIQDVLPRDAIPSIDEPSFGPDYFGDDEGRVIVVEGDPPRAYPIRILSYHEIVNDVLPEEGRAIAVTWCPICASAVVYDRTVDGRVLTFGTSGKLADDALVMYDRETGSEWKQPLGKAIAGPLDGTELAVLPAPTTTWSAFERDYPDGVVLQPVHGGDDAARGQSPRSVYDMSPYDRYDARDDFGLRAMRGEGRERTWERTDIEAKAMVLGVVDGGEATGYPLEVVDREGGVVTDVVGDRDIVVWTSGDEFGVFENPGYEFRLRDGILYADGTTWNGTTGRSDDDRRLPQVPFRQLYAFAWQDDHGPSSFYGLGTGSNS